MSTTPTGNDLIAEVRAKLEAEQYWADLAETLAEAVTDTISAYLDSDDHREWAEGMSR